MSIKLYLGRDSSSARAPVEVPIKPNAANHFLLIGPSGFGKTTVLRALIGQVRAQVPGALIIVIEFKYDKNKAADLVNFLKAAAARYGAQVRELYPALWEYVNVLKNDGIEHGKPGDFALGWPNWPWLLLKVHGNHNPFNYHGLKPEGFPVKRFVFRPTRSLSAIQRDNGPRSQVVEGHVRYKEVPFSLLLRRANINPNTVYGRIIKKLWDIEGIRDPDRLVHYAAELERRKGRNPDLNPSATYISIAEIADLLKKDRLFSKNDDFTAKLSTDYINVLDFSANSEIYDDEAAFIFKHLVDYIVSKFVRRYNVPVFLFVDEVQNLLEYEDGRRALNKLFREGRSNWVNLFVATQYLYGLPDFLIYGATHVVTVGYVPSLDDYQKLSRLIPDFKQKVKQPKAKNRDELGALVHKLRGKGWISLNKLYTERVEFAPPVSL